MSLPDSLVIRGRRYEVRLDDTLAARDLAGYIDHELRVILIDSELKAFAREEALIHEAIHAALPPGLLPEDVEERVAEALDGPLARVFRRMRREADP